MNAYVIACYVVLFVACLAGSFSHRFHANVMQSLGLGILGIWSAWRISLVWQSGWSFPHEPLLATALLFHSIGTISKTLGYVLRGKK